MYSSCPKWPMDDGEFENDKTIENAKYLFFGHNPMLQLHHIIFCDVSREFVNNFITTPLLDTPLIRCCML